MPIDYEVTVLTIASCLIEEHDLRLVFVSAAICALGCLTTVMVLSRVEMASSRKRSCLLLLAAVLFGSSVWSLHFVAMLAFMPGLPMAYDIALTVGSIAFSIGGAFLTFLVWRSALDKSLRIFICGLCLGLTIGGMHYLGVAAMRFSGFVLLDHAGVTVSFATSIGFSIVAFYRGIDLEPMARRWECTVWLSLAICGLHFTGMGAITLAPGIANSTQSVLLGTSSLGFVVGGMSVLILLVALAALMVERHLSDRGVRELHRMRLLSNLAHEALFIHRNGIILEINSAGERMVRASADSIIGNSLLSLFPDSSTPAIIRRSRARSEDLRPEELEIHASDGTRVAVELSCQAIDYLGQPATAVALRDLTDRKRDEARILHLARHDALTDLPNRYSLQERLDIALDAAVQDGTGLAIVYFDLDHFKPVNDLHGHAVGDAVLVRAAKRILAELQPTDTLARIGGDEFILVMGNGAQPEKVAATTQRIIDALRAPFLVEGNRIEIGVSAGVALYPGDGINAEALLRSADTAMYRVKDEGRGGLRFFEASMNAQQQARRRTEQELAGAVDRGELVLHYQPIVNGTTGDIETFEALIRWNHPSRGLLPPIEFISLAEQTGLIARIGEWVIDTACHTAALWPQPWRVSVNVSPAQFRNSDICRIVAAALERNTLEPARFVVEITESVLIDDARKAVEILHRLHEMGIRIALDDFGTGFSSLSYLQLFKFDKFKIDKSFVKKLGESAEALTITRAIVNLGHNLGLQVTAEGVETHQQLRTLQSLSIDQVQGYLVARPGPMDSFTELDRARVRSLFQAQAVRRMA